MIGDFFVLTALGYGVAAALIPVVNAEAYVAGAAVLMGRGDTALMVVAVTIGTVVGKVVLFRAARAGRELAASSSRTAKEPKSRFGRAVRKAGEVLIDWLDDPVRAVLTVLVSAFVGIPPLLAVAVVAGASAMRTRVFALAVFVGRAARFAVIAGAAYGLA
ncbi:MAG: VTT domain-containing protein [Aeromicrobium sp.]|uniref:hypothetical protein n=1 Tax=Aeromicrobium sp. TaxID=1871063 RepID=UPI0039E56DBF